MRLDTSPLTGPVDRAGVRAFARSDRSGSSRTGAIVALVLGLLLVGGTLGIIVPVLAVGAASDEGLAVVPVIALVAVAAIVVVIVALGARSYARSGEHAYRLARFAEANGMRWIGTVSGPGYAGALFRQPSNPIATSVIRDERDGLIDIGHFQFATGVGKQYRTHDWAYAAIHLDSTPDPLPHLVLDARGTHTLYGSHLPNDVTTGRQPALAGDGDRFFTLSCPPGSERAALAIFTPEVLAHLVRDGAARASVEIRDGWVFLYAKDRFATLDPATWEWLVETVAVLRRRVTETAG